MRIMLKILLTLNGAVIIFISAGIFHQNILLKSSPVSQAGNMTVLDSSINTNDTSLVTDADSHMVSAQWILEDYEVIDTQPEVWEPPELPDKHWMSENSLDYTYIHDPGRKVCWTDAKNSSMIGELKPIRILICVLSAPANLQQRLNIRSQLKPYIVETQYAETRWYLGRSLMVFLLAHSGNASLQEFIDQEAVEHNDIVQARFIDSYRNLTYKSVMGLHWATTRCPHADYVLKIDDDVQWLALSELQTTISAVSKNHTTGEWILCNGIANSGRPQRRQGKWTTKYSEYPEPTYPNYCAGPRGYIMSWSTAKKLYHSAQHTRFFWLEDVYITGVLRQRQNMTLRGPRGLEVRYKGHQSKELAIEAEVHNQQDSYGNTTESIEYVIISQNSSDESEWNSSTKPSV